MQIEQKPYFEPITITLDTREEADAFFGIVAGQSDDASENLCRKLCNWFSETYQ